MAGATFYAKMCGGVDEFSTSTSNVMNYCLVTSHQRHANGCHLKSPRFQIHTIAVLHNCDVEATVAAFREFSNIFSFRRQRNRKLG